MPAIATPHFRLGEWRKDSSKVDARLCSALEAVRIAGGVPIIIHVAWDNAGHAPASYHYKGQAVDFHFAPALPREKQLAAILGVHELGGIGWYPDWAHPGWHVDLRQGPRLFWVGKSGKYTYFQNDHAFSRAAGMMEANALPRGIRNNDPGNIRDSSTRWLGEDPANKDKVFEDFLKPVYGIRAIAKILLNYERFYGLDTIRKLISRWAPANENNTEAYIRLVSSMSGIEADTKIRVADCLERIIPGIIQQENSQQPYSASLIKQACDMARD